MECPWLTVNKICPRSPANFSLATLYVSPLYGIITWDPIWPALSNLYCSPFMEKKPLQRTVIKPIDTGIFFEVILPSSRMEKFKTGQIWTSSLSSSVVWGEFQMASYYFSKCLSDKRKKMWQKFHGTLYLVFSIDCVDE